MLHQRARAAHRSVWNKPLAYAEARDPDLAYGTSAHYSRFSLRDIGTILPIYPTGRQHDHVLKPWRWIIGSSAAHSVVNKVTNDSLDRVRDRV